MSTSRPTEPYRFYAYADELLQRRTQADEQVAASTQTQQAIASTDELEHLHRRVVRPVREYLPALARRGTAQLTGEGVDPVQLLALPPEVLRDAAEWAATATTPTALGRDVLAAEMHLLRTHRHFAEHVYAVFGDVRQAMDDDRSGKNRAREAVWEGEPAEPELTRRQAECAAILRDHRVAREQVRRLRAIEAALREVLANHAQASARTESFFLSALDAVALVANHWRQMERLDEAAPVHQVITHALRRPMRLYERQLQPPGTAETNEPPA